MAQREVSSGSFSTKLGYPYDVRFPPDSDRFADIAFSPVRAKSGNASHSITLLARSTSSAGDPPPVRA
jgi:hypothetical protein